MMYAVRYPDRLDDLRDLGADLALQSDIARQLWDKIEEWGSDEAPTIWTSAKRISGPSAGAPKRPP